MGAEGAVYVTFDSPEQAQQYVSLTLYELESFVLYNLILCRIFYYEIDNAKF